MIVRAAVLVATICVALSTAAQQVLPPDSVLQRMAARMLMVGFKGDEVTADSDAARYVRDLGVGAIILFDVDLTGKATIGSRNVTGKQQLQRLTGQLYRWARDGQLLIALDQEGGRVARLKTEYGFEPTVSAAYLGQTDNRDTTRFYAARLARNCVNVV